MVNKSLNQLFKLVRSLSQEEFGAILIKPAPNHQALQLINYIYKNKNSKISKSFIINDLKIKDSTYLVGLINLSFQFILDYLCEQEHNIRFKVIKMIEEIRVLSRRNQMEACIELLMEAKKIAENNDALLVQLDTILYLEKVLLRNKLSSLESKVLHQNRVTTKTKIINNFEYNMISTKLANLMQRQFNRENVGHQIQALGNHRLLCDENQAISLNAKKTYNNCHAFINQKKHNYHQSILHTQRVIDIYEQNPEYLNQNINDYISNLSDFAYRLLLTKQHEKALAVSQKVRFLYEKYPILNKIEWELTLHSYHIDIEIFNRQLQFEEATALIEKIEYAFLQLKTRLPLLHKTGILYEMAETRFFCQNYTDSLAYIQRIFQHDRQKTYVDGQVMGRFLELLVYLELKYDDKLKKRVQEIKIYLKEQKVYFRYEAMFISLIEAIIQADNQPEKLRNTYQEYLILFYSIEDLIEKEAYFDMTVWLQSKIRQCPLLQIQKEKQEKQKNAFSTTNIGNQTMDNDNTYSERKGSIMN